MKLWSGRFSGNLDPLAASYNASIPVDWRLAEVDIKGSLAWAQALQQASVLTPQEGSQIIKGLKAVQTEVQSGQFQLADSDEDVHTAIERRLTEQIGAVAGKLHTGRSRNDQVATDFRLWMIETIDEIVAQLVQLQKTLVQRAEKDLGVVLPGYTHMQQAQPILLSHWWLSFFWPLQRDLERLVALRERTATLPLGSGALAGTPFPVNRSLLAQNLGFTHVAANSIDAVSDRDFAAEFLFVAALIAIHLSRLSEMLIIFSSQEFGFIEIADAYATGSSLMPQKKNPDMLELTRGKSGSIIGRLTGLLAVLKSTPSAYDKDLQEDKAPVFETADTLALMLPIVAGVLNSLTIFPERMQAALNPGLLATDLADYLVERGVPFREAHAVIGKLVRHAQAAGIRLDQVPLNEMQAICPTFEADVAAAFDFQKSIARRDNLGGTGQTAVQQQITQAKNLLDKGV
ncbi:MAG: argininosuccinate lyase [Chloroflexi bacterium]|nr:argininosuccinate lyase [Chloroflexota bacterium]